MSPREKAKELIDKHVYYVQSSSAFGQMENAKACALITSKENIESFEAIKKYCQFNSLDIDHIIFEIRWWNEVIEHINNYEI